MRRLKWSLFGMGFLVFAAVVVYRSLGLTTYRCTVCVEFHEETACRTALGATRLDAIRAATNNACGQLVTGMADIRVCSAQEPISVDCGR